MFSKEYKISTQFEKFAHFDFFAQNFIIKLLETAHSQFCSLSAEKVQSKIYVLFFSSTSIICFDILIV